MRNKFGLFSDIVLIVGVIAMLGFVARRELSPPKTGTNASAPAPDWIAAVDSARAAAPVTQGKVPVIVFTDFQCPYCRRMDSTLARFSEENPGAVALSLVHVPLVNIHPQALQAARAFECGATTGSIYARQREFTTLDWRTLGDSLPDPARFAACVRDTVPVARITAGQAVAEQLGIHATPTVLVNGWRIDPGAPKQVTDAIHAALNGRDPNGR